MFWVFEMALCSSVLYAASILLPIVFARDYCLLSTSEKCFPTKQPVTTLVCNEYLTLSNLSEIGNLSDSKILFCEGTHYLNFVWNIDNALNVVLSSALESVVAAITCDNLESGLYFTNVYNLALKGLEFKYCGITNSAYNKNYYNRAALVFSRVGNLELNQIIIQESSTAGGFSLNNMNGKVVIKDSVFKNGKLMGNITTGNFIGHGVFNPRLTIVSILNSTFENNSHFLERKCSNKDHRFSAGLAIAIVFRNIRITLNHIAFRNNSGCGGENMAVLYLQPSKDYKYFSKVIISNNTIIEGGFANVGGGIFVLITLKTYSNNLIISNTRVVDNRAVFSGAGFFIKALEGLKINSISYINISNCHFENNKLNQTSVNGGYAIQVTTFFVKGFKSLLRPHFNISVTSSSFMNHGLSGYRSTLITSGNAVLFIKNTPYLLLENINVTNNMCSGLTAISSNIILAGAILISNNTAHSGAGILLCTNALLYFKISTKLRVTNNHAKYTGGGINIESGCTLSSPACFFQFYSRFDGNTTAVVEGNTAGSAGHNIFGGSIRSCYFVRSYYHPRNTFYKLFKVPNNSKSFNSSISSSPRRLYIKNRYYKKVIQISPGQTLRLWATIYGQESGVTPGRVYAHLNNSNVSLQRGDFIQSLALAKDYLTYHIFSEIRNEIVTLVLSVAEGNANPLVKTSSLKLNITDCPFGLKLENMNTTLTACRCNYLKNVDSHTKQQIKCKISYRPYIKYSKELWIGGVCDQEGCKRPELIGVSVVCPQDYCRKKVWLRLDDNPLVNNTVQCNFNRSGVLCGGCILGRSTILGSSECRLCTNYYLFLLIAFALAGPILVLIISSLSLTVSSGMLNGIIFYANIVQLYNSYIFRTNTSILKVFIAWLNLDLGISICLYDGMNDFSKSLLQFIFPIYLWAIAGIVIWLSKQYKVIANFFGTNPTQVLATLILLSYTKLIRASVNAVHFTRLLLPDSPHNQTYSIHWSIDGNLRFLQGKHLVIFIIGILFGLLSVLYTIILLFIGHLPRISHWPFFSWIYKLKPFFDCYTGPLSDKGRFWVGFLLLTRIFLLVAYSINISSAEATKMTVTIITMLVLLLILSLSSKGIYHSHPINILEILSIVNLGTLFTGLLCSYYYTSDSLQKVFVLSSLFTTFLLFLIIVAYYVYKRFGCSKIFRTIRLTKGSKTVSEDLNLLDRESIDASRSQGIHQSDFRDDSYSLLKDN